VGADRFGRHVLHALQTQCGQRLSNGRGHAANASTLVQMQGGE
jgi:hypothetical protein